jgi:hypothetical protein
MAKPTPWHGPENRSLHSQRLAARDQIAGPAAILRLTCVFNEVDGKSMLKAGCAESSRTLAVNGHRGRISSKDDALRQLSRRPRRKIFRRQQLRFL